MSGRCLIISMKLRSSRRNAPRGMQSVQDKSVRNNLMGVSSFMSKKGWVDSQGRKGKGFGVYRFSGKYGTNVDGYSPIYSPDEWSDSGDTFSMGTRGLLAWIGVLIIIVSVSGKLVLETSQLSQ